MPVHAEDGSSPDEAVLENILNPSPYLDIALRIRKGYNNCPW